MRSLIRPRLVAATALLLVVLGGALQQLGPAMADDQARDAHGGTRKLEPTKRAGAPSAEPTASGARNLILGSKDGSQPENMEQFLAAVTQNVDSYWTKVFEDAGLPEPRVGYTSIPAGRTAASACGDENGTLGDSAAAYCPGDDTIYISQKFATDIYTGALDQTLPGSSQGYGRTIGDFAVAYVVAHEYGHEIQDELGFFQDSGQQLPTMAFELQADCYAGTWANGAYQENRLEDGDVQEALNAALAVGDFDTADPGHHGTPDQREAAWKMGFQTGDPSSCNEYLDPANLGVGAGQP